MILTNDDIIMPEKLITELEYTGKICALDWSMLNEACSLLSDMRYEIRSLPPVSVNLSQKYKLQKDKSQEPPKYIIFFKGRDADVMRNVSEPMTVAQKNMNIVEVENTIIMSDE